MIDSVLVKAIPTTELHPNQSIFDRAIKIITEQIQIIGFIFRRLLHIVVMVVRHGSYSIRGSS